MKCWDCKNVISCLHAGQVNVRDDMGLSCEKYEREDRIPKVVLEEIKVIDGIVYRRIIGEEGDG